MEDYFLLFEDKCTLSHRCAGRVMGVLSHVREKVIKAPEYDPRNIVDLVERYGDAHINDCAAFRGIFLSKKYKGFSKFIKKKYSEPNFQFLNFKRFFLPKSDPQV